MARDDAETVTSVPARAAAKQPAGALVAGEVLGARYRIGQELGQGGGGVVYEAFDQHARVQVALKAVDAARWAGPYAGEQLFRELRFGRAIQHPNVCRLYDVLEIDGRGFLIMEYARHGTLRTTLRDPGASRPSDAKLRDARAVVAGLAAIHQAGLVHRDLKPENILRMEDGRLVVSDFGITRALAQTTTVRFAGTPGYLAPETLVGGEPSQASDVWSLGVVLHEILAGCRPRWTGRVWKMSLPRISAGDRSARAIARVCRACLRSDPRRRPKAATQVETLLDSEAHSRFYDRPALRVAGLMVALVAAILVALAVGQRVWRSIAPAAACSRQGSEICGNAGGICQRVPDSTERCYWKDVQQAQCGLFAASPLDPLNQGVWIAEDGGCSNAVSNLCTVAEWAKCRRYGATTCEVYNQPMCRWRSNEVDCNYHSNKNCWGIWTPATSGAGVPINGVPTNREGACFSHIGNLSGPPCP
jgi:hypothetical protein